MFKHKAPPMHTTGRKEDWLLASKAITEMVNQILVPSKTLNHT